LPIGRRARRRARGHPTHPRGIVAPVRARRLNHQARDVRPKENIMTQKIYRSRRRAGLICAVAAGLALIISACAATDTESNSSSSGAVDAEYPEALAFVGGTKDAPSGEPVTIGWVNNEGGQPTVPEASVGMRAAVKVINEKLGGIQGHPVKVSECLIVSAEEEGTKCAQQFLNDDNVKMVVVGPLQFGGASFYATMDGKKPVVGALAAGPPDFSAKNTFFGNSQLALISGIAHYTEQYLNPKTVAIFGPDSAAATAFTKQLTPLLEDAGIEVNAVAFPDTATDLLSTVVAGEAASSDAVVAAVFGSQCASMAKALEQAGAQDVPVVTLGLCYDKSVKEANGDYPEWDYAFPSEAELDPSSANVKEYLAALAQYAPEDAAQGAFAEMGFGGMIMAVKILNQAGPEASTDEVISTIKDLSGPQYLTGPDFKCGQSPEVPTTCAASIRVYRYDGGDTWTDQTDGKWID
jgi:branched-chain amino acid transport system substrate-binding protein